MLLGTTTDNTVDKLQIDGSLIATAIKKTGGTSTQYLMADGSVSTLASYVPTSRTLTINGTAYDLTADRSWSVGTVTSVSASVPTGFAISGSAITSSGTLAITFASGYALPTTVKQSNWDDAYTFVAAFPTQTGNAGKYLTTDGSSLSWGTVTAGVSSFNTRTGAVTLTSTDVTTALGYTPVTQARTLTINGTTFDLSADRAWTVSAGSSARNVSTFTATAGQTTFTISGGYTPNLVDVFLNGVRLTGVDFTATNGTTIVLTEGVRVNDIIDVVNYLNAATLGITGSGTANYLAKWSSTSSVTNSQIFDNGTNVGIGTASPTVKLDVVGAGKFSGNLNAAQISASANVYISSIAPTLIFSNAAQSTTFGIIQHDGTNLALNNSINGIMTFATNNVEKMRILSNGNVGIGLTNPTSLLHVEGMIKGRTSNGVAFEVTNAVNADFTIELLSGISKLGTSGNNLTFHTGSERMRITSGGNVGIGTSSPSQRLTVQGVANAWASQILGSTTPGQSLGLLVTGGTNVNDAGFLIQNAAANQVYLTVRGDGAVIVAGSLSKGSGSFRIDHPLKPESHELVHSFIEGPQADLIYRGKLTLVNGKGQANIDDVSTMTNGTFELLCRDVQCFTTNEKGWDLVKGKVIGNIIYIESQNPNSTDEISWMVIGERKDKHMMQTEWTDKNGKVIVEPLKIK
jgi:hypothetical protein